MMLRSLACLVLSLCVYSWGNATAHTVSGTPEWTSKVDPELMLTAATGAEVEFVVVMKEQADVSGAYALETKEEKGRYVYQKLKDLASLTQRPVWNRLEELKAPFRSFLIFNGLWVKGNMEVIQAMSGFTEVDRIIENAPYALQETIPEPATALGNDDRVNAMEWGITQTNTDKVWNMGFTGQGAVIGGQDTGYEWDHPAIFEQYRGWDGSNIDHNYNWHDAIHSGNGGSCGLDSPAPCDDHNHGTHTMGTMVGDDGGSNQIGMAPGAKWIGCRNMGSGAGTFATYVECFEWFIAPTDLNDANPMPAKAPHVINNSWGCPTSEGCNSSNFAAMETVVNNLKAAGIVVVASAGNSGSGCNTVQDPPAMFDNSFSIGSTTSSDNISSFSSRGKVTVDGSNLIKPDVSAPGSSVRSSVRNGTYATYSGTSMAGPHAAGLVALIISANPDIAGKVDIIEKIIRETAVKLTSSQTCDGVSGSQIPNNTFGWGRINSEAAINETINTVGLYGPKSSSSKARIYPNPASDHAMVFIPLQGGNIRGLRILDLHGKVVSILTGGSYRNMISLDHLNLAAGAYMVEVDAENNQVYREKLIVQ